MVGKKQQNEILGNYLATSFDIEDKMSSDVYGKYLDREIWPRNLGDDSFGLIEEALSILILDTDRHKELLSGLSDGLNL